MHGVLATTLYLIKFPFAHGQSLLHANKYACKICSMIWLMLMDNLTCDDCLKRNGNAISYKFYVIIPSQKTCYLTRNYS